MRFIFFFISLVMVALGQPARFGYLGCLAAVMGFALFFTTLKRRRFLWGCLWFTAVQCIQLSWMTSIEFQGFYILVVYLILALLMGAQFGLLTLLIAKQGVMSMLQLLSCAGFWMCMEWVRLLPACGFSWNPIGLSLTGTDVSLQFASIFGVYGLSFWVMLTNLSMLNAFRGGNKMVVLFLIAIPYLYGACHLGYHEFQSHQQKKSYHLALVQTALLPSEKMIYSGREKEFISYDEQWKRILRDLQANPLEKYDLIVLPEAFISRATYSADTARSLLQNIGEDFPLSSRISNLFLCRAIAHHFGSGVIGGMDYSDKIDKKNFNSAFYIDPKKLEAERYDKQILLPLAEYLPSEHLRFLSKSYGIETFFTPGKEGKVMGKMRFSPSICYEETFPSIMRRGKNQGAKLFVNMTNDNYYPQSSLHRQHLFHARVRAVENGIPLVRSCNAGISAAIDSCGRVVAQLDESQSGVLNCHLNAYTFSTLYSYCGDGWLLIFSLLVCIYQFFYKKFLRLKAVS